MRKKSSASTNAAPELSVNDTDTRPVIYRNMGTSNPFSVNNLDEPMFPGSGKTARDVLNDAGGTSASSGSTVNPRPNAWPHDPDRAKGNNARAGSGTPGGGTTGTGPSTKPLPSASSAKGTPVRPNSWPASPQYAKPAVRSGKPQQISPVRIKGASSGGGAKGSARYYGERTHLSTIDALHKMVENEGNNQRIIESMVNK
jgi:hypothetical protein